MSDQAKCELCGDPMPAGEEMFKIHGYSGPCPRPTLPAPPVGEPAPMPPEMPRLEAGDWVMDYPEEVDGICIVRPDNVDWWNDPETSATVTEIRKANGVIWRRPDRKEPTA